jgi:peptidoglycan-associated lipoprotein
MNCSKIILTVALTLGLAFVGCSKKPTPKTAPESNKPNTSLNHARSDQTTSDAEREQQEEMRRLEGQRNKVEDLMNRLMADEIYFDYDKATLTSKARDLLAQVGEILEKEPRLLVRIEGHTDERGTESYNMTLGAKRAQSVKEYLINYGVSDKRLSSTSFGEEKPKVFDSNEEAWSKNRRAAFKVSIAP